MIKWGTSWLRKKRSKWLSSKPSTIKKNRSRRRYQNNLENHLNHSILILTRLGYLMNLHISALNGDLIKMTVWIEVMCLTASHVSTKMPSSYSQESLQYKKAKSRKKIPKRSSKQSLFLTNWLCFKCLILKSLREFSNSTNKWYQELTWIKKLQKGD